MSSGGIPPESAANPTVTLWNLEEPPAQRIGYLPQELADFGRREHHRELEFRRGANQLDLGGPGSAQGLLPEELEGAEGLGGTGPGEVPLDFEVQEVLAQFLGRDRLWGFAEVFGELAHTGQIRLLCAGEQGQEAEVFEEAV